MEFLGACFGGVALGFELQRGQIGLRSRLAGERAHGEFAALFQPPRAQAVAPRGGVREDRPGRLICSAPGLAEGGGVAMAPRKPVVPLALEFAAAMGFG